MAIIARYKFNPSLCADYLPTFNAEFTGYTKTDVDNGDGTITRTISHDTLKPTFMRFGVKGAVTDREKSLLEIMQCDTSQITNMENMFRTCSNLVVLDASGFNTSKTKNMNAMFQYCSSLTNLDVSNFDTSQSTSMSNMFDNCSSLTSLDVSNFDTSNVTNMGGMFDNCSSLTSLDLSNFDTSNVNNMGGMFNKCPVSNIGLLYTTSSTINSLLAQLGTSTARNIYYTDAPLNELTVQDNITYKKYELTMATFPYTLNKLPNGVADYIDVVNKVHVQRVGVIEDASVLNWSEYTNLNNTYTCYFLHDKLPQIAKNNTTFLCIGVENRNSTTIDKSLYSAGNMSLLTFTKDTTPLVSYDIEGFKAKLAELGVKFLYELATPIYTPLTDEQIAQLPLSAYADGYVNLSSDQLTPSFEFRMKASNRYQVDMLETGYYYLNAPVGNVKLGTANVDVQQMPCIVKVDNVGTGDSGYRLGFSGNIMYTDVTSTFGGFISSINGTINTNGDGDSYTDFIKVKPKRPISATTYIETPIGRGYGVIIGEYDSNKNFIKINTTEERTITTTTTDNTHYIRVSYRCGSSDNIKKIKIGLPLFITLAKLPSHRIPTSFTQGMKCATDFGYWEGIKTATGKQLYVNETNQLNFNAIELNRIEYNNTIVEDEFDIATGKLTKRIGKYTINGNSNLWGFSVAQFETATHMSFCCSSIPNFKKGGRCVGFLGLKIGAPNSTNSEENWSNLGVSNSLYFRFKKDRYSYYGVGVNGVKAYFNVNPTTIYYELEVPEISYVNLSSNQVKTVANSTLLQSSKYNELYLNPQIKPSHLTYPVPSLVGNRTYTVVHNRKNISGSTKPIELNLGGTVVQLNDASSKTLVKTPSTLAHSNLIFIGGESTVDHIMVLDGDWTNKPIEYFENMMGHDTDAIITIIGDGKIDDVPEQYLW